MCDVTVSSEYSGIGFAYSAGSLTGGPAVTWAVSVWLESACSSASADILVDVELLVNCFCHWSTCSAVGRPGSWVAAGCPTLTSPGFVPSVDLVCVVECDSHC